jgi:hypothetical protein
MHTHLRQASVLVTCLVAAAALAVGQTTTATFYGIVADSSGATIPGAVATLTEKTTGAVASRTADGAGEFVFDFLHVGTYTLRIEAHGFKASVIDGLIFNAGQNVRRNFPLELGAVTETVNVASNMEEVNTVDAEQRQSFSRQEALELPVARRNFSNLLSIGTGVSSTSSGVRLNGLGSNGTRVTVDGTNATGNSEASYISMYQAFNYIETLSVEAIREVQVIKGVAPAEYGQQLSGTVNLITHSGTNSWHGSAIENFQSDRLNARNQFLLSKSVDVFNQFGGSIGGAIRKNKIFVFGDYEGYRESTSGLVSGNVPTAKLRAQMLAAVPAFAAILNTFPLPNQPVSATADSGFYQGAGPIRAHDDHVDVKADLRINDMTTAAFSYTHGRPYKYVASYTTNAQDWQGYQERGTANLISSGASWTSETRFGYNFNEVDRDQAYWFDSLDPSKPESTYGGRRFPTVTVPGLFSSGAEFNNRYGPLWSIEEKYAWHSGKHSFKVGAMFTQRGSGRVNIQVPNLQYANVTDLLSNTPSAIQVFFGQPRYLGRNKEAGFFAQDDWRISSKLVIDIGARYDFYGHYVATPENPTDTAGLFNLDGLRDYQFHFGPYRDPSDPVESDKWINIGPRVGFSYNPDGRAKTVIRGGFGMFFSVQPTDDYNSAVSRTKELTRQVTFSRVEGQALGLRYPVFNENVLPLLTASSQIQREYILDPHTQNPYSMNFYLGTQRELSNSLMIESAFVGTRGVKFRLDREFNEVDRVTGLRPNPNLGTGIYLDSSQNTSFWSWQNSLRKRFSHGLTANANYTWGKALGISGGDTGATFSGDASFTVQNFFDARSNRGPSAGDVRHNFVGDFIYELPKLSHIHRVLRTVAGGWQVSGILTARTGTPLLITQSCAISACRPDYAGGDVINPTYNQTLQYLNKAAFAKVPVGAASGATLRPGNLGNGAVRLPGLWNVDSSISKVFVLTEGVRLNLRADMFNFFNHTNFSAVTTDINSSNFGRFTATSGSRIIQLNARISF